MVMVVVEEAAWEPTSTAINTAYITTTSFQYEEASPRGFPKSYQEPGKCFYLLQLQSHT